LLVQAIFRYVWMVSKIKLLFICSRNKWRSLTAEKIFHGLNGYDVRTAGTEEGARIRETDGHIGWAELILVMEKKHVRRLKDKFEAVAMNVLMTACYITYILNQ
jgi:predicted protein tyrosine phosphatase